jgi:hypothetical protein
MFVLRVGLLLLAICLNWAASAQADEPKKGPSYFLIGNSLTWDTVPSALSGDAQWHVDCGVNLPYIYAHPEKPCVKTSTLWPKALAEKQYDFVSVQPHYGSTIAQDVETISAWMKLQPKAVFVIHTGWAFHARRAEEFAAYAAPVQMEHSSAYFSDLIGKLRQAHPDREIRQTFAQNLLTQVAEDIASGESPLKKVEDLYRDDIHLTHDAGKYLMHNAIRRALGQPRSSVGFDKVDTSVKTYLDGVLARLDISSADLVILKAFISVDARWRKVSKPEMFSDARLKKEATSLQPQLERSAKRFDGAIELFSHVDRIGGELHFSTSGPQWVYLATGGTFMDLLTIPTAINLYNGNNPLKGKGGRNTKATDEWLKNVVGYDTLKKIDLANCEIHGDGLKHVGTLKELRDLNLTLTPVADDALKHLAGLTELRTLGLASTKCTGTGFEHLKGLTKLENVNLHFTPVNDAGLKAISQLPLTGRLWLGHTHFTDEGAKHLAALTKLKRCGLGSQEKASSGEAVAALVNLPLVDLTLLDNQATPVGVAHAAKIATLEKLDISHGPTVGDESLKLLAQMPKLTELKIGNAQLTDDGLQALAGSKTLKTVTLSGMKKVTPAGVERLRQARPELVIDLK